MPRDVIQVPAERRTELHSRVRQITMSGEPQPQVLKDELWKWIGTWAKLHDNLEYAIDLMSMRITSLQPVPAPPPEPPKKPVPGKLHEVPLGQGGDKGDEVPEAKYPRTQPANMTPPPETSGRVHGDPETNPDRLQMQEQKDAERRGEQDPVRTGEGDQAQE